MRMNKKFGIVFLFFNVLYQFTFAQKQRDYVNKYKDIALSEMQRTGVPASITLAQGILESVSGSSTLATEANNHFGIKCHKGWLGAGYYKKDDEDTACCFRVYANAFESFVDHSEFLRNRPRYAGLFDLEIQDYKAWANGLKSAGYATDPQYAQQLIRWIDSLDLHQYDVYSKDEVAYYKIENSNTTVTNDIAVVQNPVSQKPEPEKIPIPLPEEPSPTIISNQQQHEIENTTEHNHPIATSDDTEYENNIEIIQEGEDGLFYINDVKACRARQGDNALSIANRYEVDVRKIVEFNEVNRAYTFEENDIVFLQTKKAKAKSGVDFHRIKKDETLFEISQLYGVKMKNLLKYNNLQEGYEPASGEKVALRDVHHHSVKIRTLDDSHTTQEASLGNTNHSQRKKYISHTVEKGETLWQLSKKYDVSVDKLKQINGIGDSNLKVGSTIKVEKN